MSRTNFTSVFVAVLVGTAMVVAPPPTPTWGGMLNDGRAHVFDAPHLVVFPALSVMLVILSFNFLGDALRDRLDPRLRKELL